MTEVDADLADIADLATQCGVGVDYYDQSGQFRTIKAETVVEVLAGLGVDASTPTSRNAARETLRLRDWRRALPPVFIQRQGGAGRIWVHVPHGWPVTIELETEDGFRRALNQLTHDVEPVEVDGVLVGEAAFEIPDDLPLGYHQVEALDADGSVFGSCPVIVVPQRLELPERLRDQPTWGLMAQIYSARSAMSWGIGDIGDMATLGEWAAREHDADFLLVNPLHASSPAVPIAPSPYLPVARRYFAPWYLRIEDIPEYDDLAIFDQMTIERLAAPLRSHEFLTGLLDRDAAWTAKLQALSMVYAEPLSADRVAEFEKYRAEQGQGLHDFAVWCALVEELGISGDQWPVELSRPDAPAVAAAGERLADRVRFHMWLQWLVDEQLADAKRRLESAGMAIGVVHDLAVGVHPEGSDAWALHHVLVNDMQVGCPPDMYNQVGQNWSQPPWHPWALADAAFIPYRDMLRTILRHAGGIRVDHILGLFRLWWIPQGNMPYDGAYVTYDNEAMIGILCLEAQRAGAVVIGEDLGTVEPSVQLALAERGILGTSILWFERRPDGSIITPELWRTACLSSVNVHDLPPTAGYLTGVHVQLRDHLGLLSHSVEEEWAAHNLEITEWQDLLIERGWLAEADRNNIDEQVAALHRALANSSSRMQGVALVDLVGDVVPQNQPGTDQEHPTWRIPRRDGTGQVVLIDELMNDPKLADRVGAIITAVRR
jgi:4-alpha-glucanotransferase